MLHKEVMVGSMDVMALYPSIDQVHSARIVREECLRSDLEVENIDWRAATLYLALTRISERGHCPPSPQEKKTGEKGDQQ